MNDAAARGLEAAADRHTRMRWLGAVSLTLAVPVVTAGLAALATGRIGGSVLPLCFVSIIASISAFGTNDDTALHAMAELDRGERLPPRHAAELAAESRKRPARIAEVHAHPKASYFLPLFSLSAVVWTAVVVARAWGLLA